MERPKLKVASSNQGMALWTIWQNLRLLYHHTLMLFRPQTCISEEVSLHIQFWAPCVTVRTLKTPLSPIYRLLTPDPTSVAKLDLRSLIAATRALSWRKTFVLTKAIRSDSSIWVATQPSASSTSSKAAIHMSAALKTSASPRSPQETRSRPTWLITARAREIRQSTGESCLVNWVRRSWSIWALAIINQNLTSCKRASAITLISQESGTQKPSLPIV